MKCTINCTYYKDLREVSIKVTYENKSKILYIRLMIGVFVIKIQVTFQN